MQKILIFLLFIVPLVVLPIKPSFFETPKIIIVETALFLFISLSFQKLHRFKVVDLRRYWPLLLILVLSIIHLLFFNTHLILFGNIFRLQGVFIIWLFLLFAFFTSEATRVKALGFLSSISKTKENKFPLLLPLITLITLIVSSIYFGPNQSGRAYGLLGEPNALAATAIFLWPFVFFFTNNKFLKIVSISIVGFLIALTFSRSGFIAIFIQIIFLLLKKRIDFSKSLIIALLLAIGSLVLPLIEGGGWYENRSEIWKTAIYSAMKDPDTKEISIPEVLVGQGFGNTEKVLNRTSWFLSNNVRFVYVDSAHNIILDYWVQAGLLGVIALVYLIYLSFINFSKEKDTFKAVLFLGVLTGLLFNPLSIVNLIEFWWLIGIGMVERID